MIIDIKHLNYLKHMEIRIKILIIAFFLSAIVSSCIPDSVKEKVNESMASAQSLLADQEFKKLLRT
jgi:hypothetical protein